MNFDDTEVIGHLLLNIRRPERDALVIASPEDQAIFNKIVSRIKARDFVDDSGLASSSPTNPIEYSFYDEIGVIRATTIPRSLLKVTADTPVPDRVFTKLSTESQIKRAIRTINQEIKNINQRRDSDSTTLLSMTKPQSPSASPRRLNGQATAAARRGLMNSMKENARDINHVLSLDATQRAPERGRMDAMLRLIECENLINSGEICLR